MINFDRETISFLRHIKRSGGNGITWGELRQKFGDDFPVLHGIAKLRTIHRHARPEWRLDQFR